MSPKPQTESWQDALRAMLDAQGGYEAPASDEAPAPDEAPARQKAPLTLLYERKGRGGKQATIVAGFEIPDAEIDALASKLRKRLATGGSARGGEILFQGDRRLELRRELAALGFKVKG